MNAVLNATARFGLPALRDPVASGVERGDEAVDAAGPQPASVRARTMRRDADASVVKPAPAALERADAPLSSSSPDALALHDERAPGIEEMPANTPAATDDPAGLQLQPAVNASAGTR
jgi:hypothetical protein